MAAAAEVVVPICSVLLLWVVVDGFRTGRIGRFCLRAPVASSPTDESAVWLITWRRGLGDLVLSDKGISLAR